MFLLFFFPHPKSKLMIGNSTIIIITTLNCHNKNMNSCVLLLLIFFYTQSQSWWLETPQLSLLPLCNATIKKIKILKCCGVCLKSFSQKGPKCPMVLSLICKIQCFYYYFFSTPKVKADDWKHHNYHYYPFVMPQ